MKSKNLVLAAAVVALAPVLVPWVAEAASGPDVEGVVEGVATDGVGRILLVFGARLTKVTRFELWTGTSLPIADLPVTYRTKSLVMLTLPPGQALGDYVLAYSNHGLVGTSRVRLSMGGVEPGAITNSSLSLGLADDLADAKTLEGESASQLHEASRLIGHIDDAHFSAYDDLVAEGRIGTGTSMLAPGDHHHEHDHDERYPLRSELSAGTGVLNASNNPVDWSQLKGVPAGFADGTDDQATFTAGTGLSLSSGTFSVNFGGTGTATTAARSDHTHTASEHLHTGTYLRLAGGDTVTGQITVSTTGQSISAASGTTSWSAGGIDCTASNGIAIAGHGNIGLVGDVDSDGDCGVWGRCSGAGQVGVFGTADSYAGIAVYGQSGAYKGVAVKGRTLCGTGVYGLAEESYYDCSNYGEGSNGNGAAGVKAVSKVNYSAALFAEAQGTNSAGILVNNTASSGDVAVFQSGGTNCARIALDGTGYFNGGTFNSGADFAESVAVNAPAGAFEPGDVVAIDPASPRRFSLCRTANSALVAGVVSTRPAVVGTVHDMATVGRAALTDEVRVGIVGIVPTKVCDEGGPIAIGDLLVSASLPGHAKKAPDHAAQGTLLGKALGALAKGTGKVEVLLAQR